MNITILLFLFLLVLVFYALWQIYGVFKMLYRLRKEFEETDRLVKEIRSLEE